jgi:hypothetical protein
MQTDKKRVRMPCRRFGVLPDRYLVGFLTDQSLSDQSQVVEADSASDSKIDGGFSYACLNVDPGRDFGTGVVVRSALTALTLP